MKTGKPIGFPVLVLIFPARMVCGRFVMIGKGGVNIVVFFKRFDAALLSTCYAWACLAEKYRNTTRVAFGLCTDAFNYWGNIFLFSHFYEYK